MMRGIPQDQISANLDRLRGGARDVAARELKLFFILQKIATDQNTDVDEPELNGRIAMLAAQRGERPEKMKQEMSKDGTLANLYVQMREQKAVDEILKSAEIEDVDVLEKADEAGTESAGAPAGSESAAKESEAKAGSPAGDEEGDKPTKKSRK